MGGVKTGHTVLNLEDGRVYGLGIEFNQLHLATDIYIELFTIKSHDETPIGEEEFFSKHEYEEFLEFSSDDPCEYIPDIITDFCEMKGIDEYERTDRSFWHIILRKMNRPIITCGSQRF